MMVKKTERVLLLLVMSGIFCFAQGWAAEPRKSLLGELFGKKKEVTEEIKPVKSSEFPQEPKEIKEKKGFFSLFSKKSGKEPKTTYGQKGSQGVERIEMDPPPSESSEIIFEEGVEIFAEDEIDGKVSTVPIQPSYGVDKSSSWEPKIDLHEDVLENIESGESFVMPPSPKPSPKKKSHGILTYSEVDELEKMLNSSPQRLEMRSEVPAENGLEMELPPIPQAMGEEVRSQEHVGRKVDDSTLSAAESWMSSFQRSILEVNTLGPPCIVIGMEAKYEIVVRNRGDMPSEETVVQVEIPSWMEVVATNVKVGTIELKNPPPSGENRCIWSLGTLSAQGMESLELHVIPRQKASANVQVTWSNRQISSQHSIQVEEPQITLDWDGNHSLLRGKLETLRLKLTNTGNCIAENLSCRVTCKESGEILGEVKNMGKLYPDEEKMETLEWMPQNAGEITLVTQVFMGEKEVTSHEKHGEVRFIDWKLQAIPESESFVGLETRWNLHVQNRGNTTAEGCRLKLEWPDCMEYVSSEANESPILSTGGVLWNLEKLEAGETQTIPVTLRSLREDSQALECQLYTKDLPAVEEKFPVQIAAIADLQMRLHVPKKVVGVQEEAPCEITLQNTGSLTISDARLYVFFAEGVEPKTVNKGAEITGEGIVLLDVPPLPPQESFQLRVTSGAMAPGNYPIRCQVKSESMKLDLIQQETTLFR